MRRVYTRCLPQVRVDEDVYALLIREAEEQQRSVTQTMNRLLRESLASEPQAKEKDR